MKMRFCLIICSILFIFSSCITVNQVRYIKDASSATENKLYTQPITPYKIQSNDYLYVKVLSLDPKTYSFFNADAGDNQGVTEGKLYLTSYLVSDSGYIDLPMIGKVFVKDLTIEQARQKIQLLVGEYLTQPTIILKLTSFKITVLGEVTRPGKYMVYNEQVTIFEALGLAGDITDYGDKKTVTLLRQTNQGSQVFTINLKNKNILTSELFFLKPNDVVMVQPLKAKSYGSRSFTISTLLSTITTFLLILNYTK